MRSIELSTLSLLALALTVIAAPHKVHHKRWDASSLPPTGSTTLKPRSNSDGFLTARDGKLYVGDEICTFATFNSPHLLTSDEFEVSQVTA
jgi:hypothetical protein